MQVTTQYKLYLIENKKWSHEVTWNMGEYMRHKNANRSIRGPILGHASGLTYLKPAVCDFGMNVM